MEEILRVLWEVLEMGRRRKGGKEGNGNSSRKVTIYEEHEN
jgi:hypothetical protein